MTKTMAAGWYPDPEDPTQQRYWDGARWANRAPYTHGYDRALNVVGVITYLMWLVVVYSALRVVWDFFGAAKIALLYRYDLLPDYPFKGLVLGALGFIVVVVLPAYLHAITTGGWLRTLSAWLYIRITLKTPLSFTDAASVSWVLDPDETGRWHPMEDLLAIPREQRLTELLAIANPPAGWYEDPESPDQQRYWEGTAWAGPTPDAPQSKFSRVKGFLWGEPRLAYWVIVLPILLLGLSGLYFGFDSTELSIKDDPKRVMVEFKSIGLSAEQALNLVEALRLAGVDSIEWVRPDPGKGVEVSIDDGGVPRQYYDATFRGDEVVRIVVNDDWIAYSEGKPNPHHFFFEELGGETGLYADAQDAAASNEHFAGFAFGTSPSISRTGTDTVGVFGLIDPGCEDRQYAVVFRVWRDEDGKMQKELQGIRMAPPIYNLKPIPPPP